MTEINMERLRALVEGAGGIGLALIAQLATDLPAILNALDAGCEKLIERLTRERDEALASAEAAARKWRSLCDRECGCSYDNPDDVCSYHSPKLAAAEARIVELERALSPFAKAADTMDENSLTKFLGIVADYSVCDSARAALKKEDAGS